MVRNRQASTLRRLLYATHPNMDSALAVLSAHQQMPDPEILEALRELEEEEGSGNFVLPLDGFEVAELIGEEGPLVGSMLRRLLEHRIEQGPFSKNEARKLLLDWKTNQG